MTKINKGDLIQCTYDNYYCVVQNINKTSVWGVWSLNKDKALTYALEKNDPSYYESEEEWTDEKITNVRIITPNKITNWKTHLQTNSTSKRVSK